MSTVSVSGVVLPHLDNDGVLKDMSLASKIFDDILSPYNCRSFGLDIQVLAWP